ncbi:hypothetical protein LXL04_031113 [Taraxacum kok-saghyz]
MVRLGFESSRCLIFLLICRLKLIFAEEFIASMALMLKFITDQADKIDWKIDRNEDVGPLAGVLVAVKDNICTADMPSTAGSKIFFHPSVAMINSMSPVASEYEVVDFTSQFSPKDYFESQPLKGLRVGVIRETLRDGVDEEVVLSIRGAISHMEELGCIVTEVLLPSFSLGLPAYYVLTSFESSSNLYHRLHLRLHFPEQAVDGVGANESKQQHVENID